MLWQVQSYATRREGPSRKILQDDDGGGEGAEGGADSSSSGGGGGSSGDSLSVFDGGGACS